MSVAIDMQDQVSAAVTRLYAGLSDPTCLHETIARRAGDLTFEYLRQIAATKHKTAKGVKGVRRLNAENLDSM